MVAFAATACSAFAGGIAGTDAKAGAPVTAADRPAARSGDVRGSGIPGTVVFHGADGMVIRTTVPGAAAAPAYGAAVPSRPQPPAQARPVAAPHPLGGVGGGFTPEE